MFTSDFKLEKNRLTNEQRTKSVGLNLPQKSNCGAKLKVNRMWQIWPYLDVGRGVGECVLGVGECVLVVE